MNKRVLIVDDDKAMVATLADIIELRGWETLRAYDGQTAVALVEEHRPDVVLMDVRMEGMDGVEAFRRIKRISPRTRVVLMTAYAARELLEEAEEEGVLRILKKPVPPTVILDLLAEARTQARSVLIVDDDPSFRATLSEALEVHGCEPVAVGSLAEALEYLERGSTRVVLLDLVLPHVDPRSSLVAIRQVSPSVLLILYSGHREELARTIEEEASNLVDRTFLKPLPIDDLIEWIQAH